MSPIRIACFEYQDTRAGQAAVNFLEGFQGCVVSDGYSGYSKVKDLTRGGCWAHTRRKWYEALPGELRVKDSKNDSVVKQPDPALECDALRALCLINELFRLEREYAKSKLTPAQRLVKRKAEAKPILDKYWALVDSIQNSNGKLHDAWTYSQRQRPYLMAFMENGELEISNNQAENVIRNLVVGRKNWLFCDSQDGARATALYYSLMVTAQINGLRVYDYVQYILDAMSGAIYGKQPRNTVEMDALLDELMPWSSLMQERFEAPWMQEVMAI